MLLSSTEIAERIEYIPGSGQRLLFPDAELQLCDLSCQTRNVSVQVSMATNHIGKGCDRDTYSVESQRKLCGKMRSRHTSSMLLCLAREVGSSMHTPLQQRNLCRKSRSRLHKRSGASAVVCSVTSAREEDSMANALILVFPASSAVQR